jgi:hypothetical protein
LARDTRQSQGDDAVVTRDREHLWPATREQISDNPTITSTNPGPIARRLRVRRPNAPTLIGLRMRAQGSGSRHMANSTLRFVPR